MVMYTYLMEGGIVWIRIDATIASIASMAMVIWSVATVRYCNLYL